MVDLGSVDKVFGSISGALSHLPLLHLLAGILLIVVIVYAIAEKLKGFLIWVGIQAILYYTTKSYVELMNAGKDLVVPTYVKFSPFIYMDKALKFAVSDIPVAVNSSGTTTFIPTTSSPYYVDLVYPILFSVALTFLYFIYMLYSEFKSKNKGEFLPIFAVLFTFGIFGGGSGLWKWMGTVKIGWLSFQSIFLIVLILYSVVVYLFDFWMPSQKERGVKAELGELSVRRSEAAEKLLPERKRRR